MRTRLRLGAAGAVALGALLLATVLASPALAWHSTVEAEASCLPDGSVLVEFTVTPFEDGHDATVDVFYVLNDDKPVGLVSDRGPEQSDLRRVRPAARHHRHPDRGRGRPLGEDRREDQEQGPRRPAQVRGGRPPPRRLRRRPRPRRPLPETTAPPTTAPETSVSPSTSLEETTTTAAAVGGATSTTSGGQLPFTGAGSSGPMLLAGIVLVGGGALVLLVGRIRDHHATR